MSDKWERRILQNLSEFDKFISMMRAENVKSYLEIGCKYGGSWWRMAMSLPKGSKLVGVDLPHGDHSFKEALPYLKECHKKLRSLKYDAHLFIGDSTNPDIVEAVRKLGPFDLCFIDGNHTEPFILKDWENYGSISRIVAFHDISYQYRPPSEQKIELTVDAPRMWNELKQPFRNVEIKFNRRDNGIGILWR
jgi:predicted O-methyltransferase YrrM